MPSLIQTSRHFLARVYLFSVSLSPGYSLPKSILTMLWGLFVYNASRPSGVIMSYGGARTSSIETLETSYRNPLKGMISAIGWGFRVPLNSCFSQDPVGVFEKTFFVSYHGEKEKSKWTLRHLPPCPSRLRSSVIKKVTSYLF